MDKVRKKLDECIDCDLDKLGLELEEDERKKIVSEIKILYDARNNDEQIKSEKKTNVAKIIIGFIGGVAAAWFSGAQVFGILNHEDGDIANSKSLQFVQKTDLKRFYK